MEQNTNDWHAWRKKGIGASDAPILMGVSKFKTLHQLWLEKTGRAESSVSSFITDRGNKVEPIARAAYALEFNVDMEPKTYQHFWYQVLRCSMDGVNEELNKGLEIKMVGLDKYECLKAGDCIPEYFPQVQHQLLVTGLSSIDLYGYYLQPAYSKDNDFLHRGLTACVNVKPDVEYLAGYVNVAMNFWHMVVNDIEPPLPAPKVKRARKKAEV